MNYLHVRGTGLPNVYAINGYATAEGPEGPMVSLVDVRGLYQALARAICSRSGTLTAAEVKFLRKRIGFSQAEVGALSGKTDQPVAKWEKGQTAVPVAESHLLRQAWMARNDARMLRSSVMAHGAEAEQPPLYALVHNGHRWQHDDVQASRIAALLARPVVTEVLLRASAQATINNMGAPRPDARIEFGWANT